VQDSSVREPLMIIDKQDGNLENDIRYGDGDKMKINGQKIRYVRK